MSCWTYIRGTIEVSPMGRTQPELRYILETVLSHLPRVTGSEGDMSVHIVQRSGHNGSCNCDEFGMFTNNLVDKYGYKSEHNGWLETQDEFILVVDGALRDRVYEETFREFMTWLCRLAKRVSVNDVLVKIDCPYYKSFVIQDDSKFGKMFELPSWANKKHEPTWCEYLMWEPSKGWRGDSTHHLPMALEYKYYNNPENDEAFERLNGYDHRIDS